MAWSRCKGVYVLRTDSAVAAEYAALKMTSQRDSNSTAGRTPKPRHRLSNACCRRDNLGCSRTNNREEASRRALADRLRSARKRARPKGPHVASAERGCSPLNPWIVIPTRGAIEKCSPVAITTPSCLDYSDVSLRFVSWREVCARRSLQVSVHNTGGCPLTADLVLFDRTITKRVLPGVWFASRCGFSVVANANSSDTSSAKRCDSRVRG